MVLLFVAWGVFFVYCLLKFRQRSGHRAVIDPIKAKVSKWAEIGVAVFEAALLIGLAIPVWASVKRDFPSDTGDAPAQHVRVVAEQFAWNFHYPGPDGAFGRTGPQFINMATNILGRDPSDPHGADDVVSGELHIVKDRPVIAEITSKDVIHSFFLPVMRVKQDAVPGMRIPVWFKAALTGNYEVACAQLCGNNHYSMRALMAVHGTQQEFDAWLESKRPVEFDEDELD
jgi:cytochrome c oxidase subunit 2